nr:GNAT family N-acetyltransferase [Ancylobacter dichloromethanicus]
MCGAASLVGPGLSLRLESPEDAAFLGALFESVRWPELDGCGWPDEVRRVFLAQQFRCQTAHYAGAYADAAFLIVERDGAPVGRLYLDRGPREHRIVDISLLPEMRNRGYGGALLDQVCAEADARGRITSLHVAESNPAQRLYRRKGFRAAGESGPYRLMIREPETVGRRGAR